MTQRRKESAVMNLAADFVIGDKDITFYGHMKLGTLHAVLTELRTKHPELIGYEIHLKAAKPRKYEVR